MITRDLLEIIYEAASIQRWNDHIRPSQGFTELDKQAHKMVYAYVLGKLEETSGGHKFDWPRLIEGGLFEFLHRIALTDIKPPVFHEIMGKKAEEINKWVLRRYEELLREVNPTLYDRLNSYLLDPDWCAWEKRLLKAAHYLATQWEFKIIERLNQGIYGVDATRREIEDQITQHKDLAGVKELLVERPITNFMDLVGQLRFQQRWAQTPRVPQTSVLGHMLVVAQLAYFCSLEIGACPKRLYNNFFCGLFHDLPEVLTRDIVAPVKRSVPDLDELIKGIERTWAEERLYPLLPEEWREEIKYLIEDEFEDRTRYNGQRRNGPVVNCNSHDPVDGKLIKACDDLAAHVEAFLSILHGVKSRHLKEAVSALHCEYRQKEVSGLDFGKVFRAFDPVELA